MAKEQLLLQREQNYPPIVKRYISKYRETKGLNARRNTRESNKWFMSRITKDTHLRAEVVHRQILKESRRTKPSDKGLIGRMFLYNYDPRWKNILPVYDGWPLVFFFNMKLGDGVSFGEKGVMYLFGLNVHYLPPRFRLMLFAELQRLKNDSTLREKTRLRLTWDIIKQFASLKYAEHAVKVYRSDHIRTELAEVHPDQWEVVIPMQIAEWHKGGKHEAWKLK
ncbi:DNA end protector [Vibrio phage VAP7]|uniref:DNA end protector n=2 Tax=Vapseptimavirus VAP7 TaxID=2841303 RepID=A0A4Y5TX19_9CAUD|nr:DNA end protector [Vibrio phage VAP7]AWY10183.1 DNA end protector during packaging [Vibrio phage VP-1]QDB73186.1 DNA end protector [Vibrio phage VAP7]UFD98129.1 DNA end protector protein [Vibrio phage BX-1]